MTIVLQNLLANAMKYQPPGAVPRIHLQAHREQTSWTITVRDNGIGFRPEYAERIFGLFKRLHTDRYEGTGLGLAVCRRIIERYHGRIWAESPGEGMGATVSMTLPEAGAAP
jgi:light-regulated signal transduction histidine kinase (bacteriophytochrome)